MPDFSVSADDINDLELRSGRRCSLARFLPNRFSSWFWGTDGEDEDFLVEMMEELETEAQRFNTDVGNKMDFDSYISHQEFSDLGEEAKRVWDILNTLDSVGWYFDIDDYLVERFEQVKTEFIDSLEALGEYNDSFVEKELDRFDHLFSGGRYSLDERQKKAVVRDGVYNQVIAGAGAGKTLVLTHRVAYLVEKGFEPEKIVVLTLTRKAREEIKRRLEENFGIEDVEVKTFHSLGFKILHRGTEMKKTIVDTADKENFIEDQLEELEPESSLRTHLRDFLHIRDDDFISRDDFESEKEFIEARAESSYRTLNGDEVKSRGEKFIADFLFAHNIDYRYEALAEWVNESKDRQAYNPDFYLPEYDVYIEHWGIDEEGRVPEWFSWSTEKYKNKMKWARRQFENSDYELIETYDSEYRDEVFSEVLKERLREKGVVVESIEVDELVRQVEHGQKGLKKIKREFRKFIETAKTFDKSPKDIERQLRNESEKKKYHFGLCGKILLERYEEWKERNQLIDFQDQIYSSIDRIKSNPEKFGSLYDHILVDEFQDVAKGQVELVKLLTGRNKANLFCVGDDWQSIYGFRGGVVDYFIEFQEYFGEPVQTKLVKNYRSKPPLVQSGNSLIKSNSRQIDKELKPVKQGSKSPKVHTIDGYNGRDYRGNLADHAAEIAKYYVQNGSEPEEIMVLSRLDSATVLTDLVKRKLKEKELPVEGKREEGVEVTSAHSSKGREAKHVIAIHAAEGHSGFSPETEDGELINIVRDTEVDTEAEERRLFYVTITRAKDTLDILTKAGEKSVFLNEISEHLVDLRSVSNPGRKGEKVEIRATVERLWEDTHDKIRQAGVLKDSTGTRKFIAWRDTTSLELSCNQEYRFRNLRVAEGQEGEKELHFTEETEVYK